MVNICNTLKAQYDIDAINISKTRGGLSASAYKVETADTKYFLKVYDKRLSQTKLWIENIDSYIPILLWLNQNPGLQGKIIKPITTNKGGCRYEDEEYVYILFDFIAGQAVAKKKLSHAQVIQLAEIIAHLHSCGPDIPFVTEKLTESFDMPFCSALYEFYLDAYYASPDDIREIMEPCRDNIALMIHEAKALADKFKHQDNNMVLCHTDAHRFNLMQGDRLVLVDWEGMKLAPAEADLFMFLVTEYGFTFLQHYKSLRPDFEIDSQMIKFYAHRRKLEDIWAFLESLLYDSMTKTQRKSSLTYLANECKDLYKFCF